MRRDVEGWGSGAAPTPSPVLKHVENTVYRGDIGKDVEDQN